MFRNQVRSVLPLTVNCVFPLLNPIVFMLVVFWSMSEIKRAHDVHHCDVLSITKAHVFHLY